MKIVYKLALFGLIMCLGVMVFGVSGAEATDYGLSYVKNKGLVESSPGVVVGNIIKAVLGIIGVVLLVMMIYGGVMYMTSAGSEDRTGTAKKVLTYAIIGLVIIALSYVITSYIISALFSGSTSGGGSSGTGTGGYSSDGTTTNFSGGTITNVSGN